MAQTSDELRTEIEVTREQMGDTVEALAYKADVPARTKDWLGEKKDAVVSKVSGTASRVGDATPAPEDVKQSVGGLRRTAERNPLGLAIAGAAAGFLAGIVVPSTRVEDERIGPMSDEMKSTAAEAGREAVERGKIVAQEAGATAVEAAKATGREQSEEMTASLQQKAHEVRREVSSETTKGAG
jgi:Protein of unknown function (DUF3618)